MTDSPAFHPLGQYQWPAKAVDRGIDTLRAELRKRFKPKEMALDPETHPLIPLSAERLDQIAEPPAHHPWLAALDETLLLRDREETPAVRMIVLPPCDREDLLTQWAARHELPLFSLDHDRNALDDLDDPNAPPLVVPKLERRFLRTRPGLRDVRLLLDRLAHMERRLILGCNSWAWQFLRKSCEIDLIFDEPLIPPAMDRIALRSWLGTSAHDTLDEDALCFRSVKNGEDVFGNGEGDAEVSSFITDLAKRSLGIPWVAWHAWRDCLHVEKPDVPDETDEPETSDSEDTDPVSPSATGVEHDARETVWVTELLPTRVPARSDQNALLVLHALLIHGGLTEDQIVQTVPLISYTNVLSSLQRARLIDRTDELYRCCPAAYPAIRDALGNSGYPLDKL